MLQQLLNSCAPSSAGGGGVPAGATLDLPSMLWRAYLANHCSAFTKICCKKCFQIAAQCGEDGFLCSSGADVVCFHFVRQEAQRFGKRKKKVFSRSHYIRNVANQRLLELGSSNHFILLLGLSPSFMRNRLRLSDLCS